MKKILFGALALSALTFVSCKKYDSVTLNHVQFNPIAQSNSIGGDWDTADDYDLYMQVKNKDGITLYESEVSNNWSLNSKIYLDLNIPFSDIEEDQILIYLMDKDLGETQDDQISSFAFELKDEADNSPLSKTWLGTTCEIDLTWNK